MRAAVASSLGVLQSAMSPAAISTGSPGLAEEPAHRPGGTTLWAEDVTVGRRIGGQLKEVAAPSDRQSPIRGHRPVQPRAVPPRQRRSALAAQDASDEADHDPEDSEQ